MLIAAWVLAVLVVTGVVIVLVALRLLHGGTPGKRTCARCGAAALHGYSQKAESEHKNIEPICLACLLKQLEQDYAAYQGRTVVVQPVSNVPCYVFRDRGYLQWVSPDAQHLDHEVHNLLAQIGPCADCGNAAHCLWIESRGLDGKTVEVVLKRGLAKTLLAWGNPRPVSLCGECTVRHISQSLRGEGFSYMEVCSPHGTEEGVVVPMEY
jgi:hypothetical protein